MHEQVIIDYSPALTGTVSLDGAKNAVLAIMASLIMAPGKSTLNNVPASSDVYHMLALLKNLGAEVCFNPEERTVHIDTSLINSFAVAPDIMNKMRASILVMGPLLGRYGKAEVALPGGCLIGARPIDLHLKSFELMGAVITEENNFLCARTQAPEGHLVARRIILEYPSVGATENIMMAAVLTPGITTIVNAALEPEVFDLVTVLRKMGARISYATPATICIEGVESLQPIEHAIMADRLEAGTLILAAAITGGQIALTNAPVDSMELFLQKIREMGHQVTVDENNCLQFQATQKPQAVSFKTMPHPGFPTDLQAPMMAALCLASGTSVISETVFENRMLHVRELQKMGAQIELNGSTAKVTGVEQLYGTQVIATDIRASAALVIAGLAAQGTTHMTGVHHLRRGYHGLDKKLHKLGAQLKFCSVEPVTTEIMSEKKSAFGLQEKA